MTGSAEAEYSLLIRLFCGAKDGDERKYGIARSDFLAIDISINYASVIRVSVAISVEYARFYLQILCDYNDKFLMFSFFQKD
jgi:hypothetical protein